MSGTGKINDFVPIGTSLVGEVTLLGKVTGKNNKDEQIERLRKQLKETQQDLQIRINDNADMYAKLCNALMQLDEANAIILSLIDSRSTAVETYIKKYGVKNESR